MVMEIIVIFDAMLLQAHQGEMMVNISSFVVIIIVIVVLVLTIDV